MEGGQGCPYRMFQSPVWGSSARGPKTGQVPLPAPAVSSSCACVASSCCPPPGRPLALSVTKLARPEVEI